LLLMTTALVTSTVSGIAYAADAPIAGGSSEVLGELVVTATKQTESVNRVPISVTAVTQEGIEEEGIKTVQDLGRTVPALQITPGNAANGSNIAIRGIASTIGASTTGVYIDDVPLQRRTTLGTFSGSGTVFPQLFDLDRVEVLKGPQGTLYGGSAEGGAVRFITPTPSLTTYSAFARGEASDTDGGGLNYETGLAIGGPIVQDKLGFRLSGYNRRDGGYLDHVDIYTANSIANNTNTTDRSAYRGELFWKATPDFGITAGIYDSREHHKDTDNNWENVAATTVPTAAFTATGATTTVGASNVNFVLPGYTYGPYNMFGPGKTGANCNIGANYAKLIAPCYEGQPRTSDLIVANITLDYDLHFALAHFTSAYIDDQNQGYTDGSYGETSSYQGGVPFLYTFPLFFGKAEYQNKRRAITEELRFSSPTTTDRLTWVGGLFYSYQHTRAESHDYTLDGPFAPYLRGVPDYIVYGAPVAANGDITARYQTLKEKEMAVFGQGTFLITPKLKLIFGGRYSQTSFGYNTTLYGAFFGYAVPTAANGGLSSGEKTEDTFLPKAGLQYDFTPTSNAYFTASEGFRPGGVNTGPYQFKCASTFASLGITDTPRQFSSDSLWSYEVGAKSRLGGRAQVNVSAFYIDWKNVQVNYTLPSPCGFAYVTNAGGAISRGGDLQTQVKLFGGFSTSLNAAYTNAYYSSALVGPAPTFSVFIRKGDSLPIPGFSANLGLRYDTSNFMGQTAYARIDYQYNGPYKRGYGPGTASYNIDTYNASETRYATARVAVMLKGVEIAAFANNFTNSQDILNRSGGRSCGNASCSVVRSNNPIFVDTLFTPQTIGMSLTYKR
jgi:outer membrane receptor protein involved in Fe transport